MGRFVFKLHHNEKELLEFEKKEKNLKVRERIRAIRLMMYSGHSKKLICEMIGRGRSTVLDWCHRYNKKGIEGLRDSKNLGGSVALCDIIGRDIIEDALSKPPPDGGLWTGPKLTKWLSDYVGYPVGETQGWRTLRRLGYTIQVPKPANTKADKKRQADFKKSVAESLKRMQKKLSEINRQSLGSR